MAGNRAGGNGVGVGMLGDGDLTSCSVASLLKEGPVRDAITRGSRLQAAALLHDVCLVLMMKAGCSLLLWLHATATKEESEATDYTCKLKQSETYLVTNRDRLREVLQIVRRSSSFPAEERIQHMSHTSGVPRLLDVVERVAKLLQCGLGDKTSPPHLCQVRKHAADLEVLCTMEDKTKAEEDDSDGDHIDDAKGALKDGDKFEEEQKLDIQQVLLAEIVASDMERAATPPLRLNGVLLLYVRGGEFSNWNEQPPPCGSVLCRFGVILFHTIERNLLSNEPVLTFL